MRLIDADALMAEMHNVILEDGEDRKTFYEVIERQPTIEERKTGKWKGYNADNPKWQRTDGTPIFLVCSECNGSVLNNGSAHWNFCPSCGADMRDKETAE